MKQFTRKRVFKELINEASKRFSQNNNEEFEVLIGCPIHRCARERHPAQLLLIGCGAALALDGCGVCAAYGRQNRQEEQNWQLKPT